MTNKYEDSYRAVCALYDEFYSLLSDLHGDMRANITSYERGVEADLAELRDKLENLAKGIEK